MLGYKEKRANAMGCRENNQADRDGMFSGAEKARENEHSKEPYGLGREKYEEMEVTREARMDHEVQRERDGGIRQ